MQENSQFTLEDFQRQYKIEQRLGGGKFGVVEQVLHRPTNSRFALKQVHCSKEEYAREVDQEIQILTQLQHPRVIKIYRYYRKMYAPGSQRGYCTYGIILELGIYSLQQCLRDQHYSYSLSDVKRLLVQLIELGAYLEQQQLVHRDIKPANIIIFGPHLDFKLADFGLGCLVTQRPKGFAGTLHYASPRLVEFYHTCRMSRKLMAPLSNAFKDDVYSVALTITEVLDHIKYNWKTKLRKDDDELNQTLHEMLEHHQRERPTFCQLMQRRFINEQFKQPEVVEDNPFKNITLMEAPPRKIQEQTIKKLNELQIEHQNVFTERYRIAVREELYFQVPFKPRTLCKITSSLLLCGCQNGQLVIFDFFTKESFNLSLRHELYVSKVAVDDNGNVWTAGGDGLMFFFNLTTLIYCIQNKRQTKKTTVKSIYKPTTVQHSIEINIAEQDYRVFRPIPDKKHISHFLSKDENRFAVGYSDGMVHVTWFDRQASYHNHFEVVTALHVADSQLYASFYNGIITRYNLKTFRKENTLIRFKDTVLDFYVEIMNLGVRIQAVTSNGFLEKIQIEKDRSFSFYEETQHKNLLGACVVEGQWAMLSTEGNLILGSEEIARCPMRKGWSQLQASSNWLLGCSVENHIMLVQLDRE